MSSEELYLITHKNTYENNNIIYTFRHFTSFEILKQYTYRYEIATHYIKHLDMSENNDLVLLTVWDLYDMINVIVNRDF